MSESPDSPIAAMSDQFLGEALRDIVARVEQVLSLQVKLEHNVSDLMAGQITTQSAISDLSRTFGKGLAAAEVLPVTTASPEGHGIKGCVTSDAVLSSTSGSRSAQGGGLAVAELLPVTTDAPERHGIKGRMASDAVLSLTSGLRDARGMDTTTLRTASMPTPGARASSTAANTGRTASTMSHGMDLVAAHTSASSEPTIRRSAVALRRNTTSKPIEDLAGASEVCDEQLDMRLEDLLRSCPTNATSMRAKLQEDLDSGRFILDPHCKLRVAHDLVSILVLAFDVISAPVILAWKLRVEGPLYAVSVVSMAFWMLDMCMSCITGFYKQGERELRPRRVIQRYLKSWFIPDAVIVFADMATLAFGEAADSSRQSGSGALRMTKASRFLRLMRLCRVARISDSFKRLMESNPYMDICFETMKPLLAIIFINHSLACVWWSISRYLPSDTGLRWIDSRVSSGADLLYKDAGVPFQYTTCLHWSLTQFTPGSMQVFPLNFFERTFSCFGLLLGMLIFSSLISSISAKMMQHYLMQKDKLTKLAALRRFLEHKVSPATSISAQYQANIAFFGNTGKPVTVKEVAAIARLPQALQRTIQVELCAKHLRHPLFRWWSHFDRNGAQALCHNAIDFVALAAEDHLFFPRANASGAYVMTCGAALYVLEEENPLERSDRVVSEGRFFCEAALWSVWKHMGELTATMGCALLLIRTSGLMKCLDQDFAVKHVAVQYGRVFYARLTAESLPDMEDPNDLTVPFTDFDKILPSLPAECRQLVGAVARNVHRQKQGLREMNDDDIREVSNGTCCLLVNWEGDVERIVSIIVLRLLQPDGRILYRLGLQRDDNIQACCELPGKKQMYGESPEQAFASFFRGAFAPFEESIVFVGAELEETSKESRRLKMSTKYSRTVKHAELDCPVEDLGLESTQVTIQRKRRSDASMAISFSKGSFRGGSGSSLSLPEPGEAGDELKMYALADESGEMTLVAWLTSEESCFFSSPKGEALLQLMMQHCDLPLAIEERARARHEAACHARQHGQDADEVAALLESHPLFVRPRGSLVGASASLRRSSV